MSEAELDLLADKLVERLAPRLAEVLQELPGQAPPADAGLVDAAAVAAALGVSRATVYAHKDELGARRLGGDTNRTPGAERRGGARLRFDLEEAREQWAARTSTPEAKPARSVNTPRARGGHRGDVALLPIRSRAA